MKKHVRSRILSVLLAAVLLMSLLSVTAFADDPVAAIGTDKYYTLAQAFAEVPKNGSATTIKLLKGNISCTIPDIAVGQNIILDLNNQTVYVEGSGSAVDSTTATIVNRGTLTVRNGTLSDYGRGNYLIANYGTLNLESTAVIDGWANGIYNCGGTLNFSGKIQNIYDYAIRVTSGSANLTGGEILANNAVYAGSGSRCLVIGGSTTSVNITGGEFVSAGTAIEMGRGTLNISGGTFDGAEYSLNQTVNSNTQVNITGGTFENVKLKASSTLQNCTINGTLDLGSYTKHTIENIDLGSDGTIKSDRYVVGDNGQLTEKTSHVVTFTSADSDKGTIQINSYECNYGYHKGSNGSANDVLRTWDVLDGSPVTVKATAHPKENYIFAGWFNNADGNGNPIATSEEVTFKTDADGLKDNVSYYAVFKTSEEYNQMVAAAYTWVANYDTKTEFTIGSVSDMQSFAYAVNYLNKDFSGKTVKLTASLTYTDTDSFTPIGTETNHFKGTFDGDGKTITGLSCIGTKGSGYIGLFGYVDNATIQNLTLTGVNFDGGYMTGGFAGEANSSSFTNCVITDSTLSNGYFLGGIFGHSSQTCTVNGCRVEDVTFNGYWKTGGVTGYADGVTISDTTVTDSSIKNSAMSGALVGHANSGATTITDVAVSGVKDENGEKTLAIGTTYAGGDSQSITVSGDKTNIDAAGIVPPESEATVKVSGGDFTFAIPEEFISSASGIDKVSVTFKSDDEIIIVEVIDKGSTAELPADPEKEGYTFLGWYSGSTEVTEDTTFNAATEVVARWGEIPAAIPTPNGITVTQPANGTVKVNPSNGSAGTLITVTATPDKGYELAYITVDGEKISGNTFRMPDKAVTVSAVFVTSDFPFVDVKPGDWHYDYIAYVYENGLMNGVSATTFEPNANMTRAMVWTILARIDGETVTGANWIDTARAWAMAEGVSDGTDPNGLVTREQFATMLYRYAVAKGYDVSIGESTNILSYADYDEISEWAIPAMQWACGSGVITGVTESTLVPQGTATRAQCAAMLMRFMEL